MLNRIDPEQRLTFFTGVLSRAGAPQATAQSAAVTMVMAMVQVEVLCRGFFMNADFQFKDSFVFPAQTLETSFKSEV